MRALSGMLLAGLVLLLAACGGTNPPSPSPVAETPPAATPVSTSDTLELPSRVPVSPVGTTPDPSHPLVLTLWVPEEFAPGAELGGDVLAKQIADFQTAHPNVTINYVLKAPYGKGGILDWLQQLQELMPDRLPDAAIVDSRDLDQIEKLGLLVPLNHDLPSGAYWDLFPPAQQIARRSGQWDNQPLTLDTEHLVYDSHRVPVPPVSWQDVLTNTTSFAFATNSTESFLFQYMENGGSLEPAAQHTSDASVMQSILDYYQRARSNGILNENTAGMKSAREVMPLFVAGQVPMAQVRAHDFLVERARLPNALAAPIPTRDGRAATLVSSWSFVVLTHDGNKQRAATDYLSWLIDPARMGEWADAAKMIPAGKGAFAQSINSPSYAEIVWNLMQNGLVEPSFTEQAPYASAWQDAVQAVLDGQLSPDDAAFRAVQAITQ